MKEWILENTNVSSELYDLLLRSDGLSKKMSDDMNKLILAWIDDFTLNPTDFNALKLGIKKENEGYNFFDIKFELLSDCFEDPRLLTKKRYHKCHLASYELATIMKGDLVTAKCIDWFNNSFLHSFVVVDNKIVYDYCLNLIMSKKDYYKLLDVKEIKIIEYPKLIEYQKLLRENVHLFSGLIDYKEIVTFPEEIEEAVLKLIKKRG